MEVAGLLPDCSNLTDVINANMVGGFFVFFFGGGAVYRRGVEGVEAGEVDRV